jgi:hypothetical protein
MHPIQRALQALQACDAQLSNVATDSPTTRVNIGAARTMARASIAELNSLLAKPITATREPISDLHALIEDSWTCQCTRCDIKSYHDSDVGQPCIKGRTCDGMMEGRMAIDLRADRDARR